MATVTRQLVNEYIRAARSAAPSEPDLSVIRLAALINISPVRAQRELNRELGFKGLYIPSLKFAADHEKRSAKRKGGPPGQSQKSRKVGPSSLQVAAAHSRGDSCCAVHEETISEGNCAVEQIRGQSHLRNWRIPGCKVRCAHGKPSGTC